MPNPAGQRPARSAGRHRAGYGGRAAPAPLAFAPPNPGGGQADGRNTIYRKGFYTDQEQDLKAGLGAVWLPKALAVK